MFVVYWIHILLYLSSHTKETAAKLCMECILSYVLRVLDPHTPSKETYKIQKDSLNIKKLRKQLIQCLHPRGIKSGLLCFVFSDDISSDLNLVSIITACYIILSVCLQSCKSVRMCNGPCRRYETYRGAAKAGRSVPQVRNLSRRSEAQPREYHHNSLRTR